MVVKKTSHRQRVERPVAVTALVIAVLAPVLWFSHLAVMYALVPIACRVGSDTPFHVATGVALIGLVACSAVAVRLAPERSLRGVLRGSLGTTPDGTDHDRAVPALVAGAMAVYFVFVAAMTGLAPLVVDRCA